MIGRTSTLKCALVLLNKDDNEAAKLTPHIKDPHVPSAGNLLTHIIFT